MGQETRSPVRLPVRPETLVEASASRQRRRPGSVGGQSRSALITTHIVNEGIRFPPPAVLRPNPANPASSESLHQIVT